MSVFVDASSLYAVLDLDDRFHEPAAATWRDLLVDEVTLVTSNYVLVECYALVQRRLGMDATRAFATRLVRVLERE